MEQFKSKIKSMKDKNEKLTLTIDDQKIKIEKLILSKNQ